MMQIQYFSMPRIRAGDAILAMTYSNSEFATLLAAAQ